MNVFQSTPLLKHWSSAIIPFGAALDNSLDFGDVTLNKIRCQFSMENKIWTTEIFMTEMEADRQNQKE